MVWDWFFEDSWRRESDNQYFPHAQGSRGTRTWRTINGCFADGHARAFRYFDVYLGDPSLWSQHAFSWNRFYPGQAVSSIDQPCSPTCEEQAARGG